MWKVFVNTMGGQEKYPEETAQKSTYINFQIKKLRNLGRNYQMKWPKNEDSVKV